MPNTDKLFRINLDLSLNELKNATFEILQTDPSEESLAGQEARFWYNATAKRLRYFDGEHIVNGTEITAGDGIEVNGETVSIKLNPGNNHGLVISSSGLALNLASASVDGTISSSDFVKLQNISAGANKVEASSTNGNILIDNVETTVYSLPVTTESQLNKRTYTQGFQDVPDDAHYISEKLAKTSIDAVASGLSDEVTRAKNAEQIIAGDLSYHTSNTSVHTNATEKAYWNAKQEEITGAATSILDDNLAISKALVSDANGKVAASGTTATEIGYVSGVTSAIQTQINSKQPNLSQAQLDAVNSGITSALVTQIGTNQSDISTINGKIPTEASTSNQLADKSFVTTAIQTNAANFRGNWNNWTAVPTTVNDYPEDAYGNKTPTANDYLVIQDASDYAETTLSGTWRFKYTSNWADEGKSGWEPEYQISSVPLSAGYGIDITGATISATNIRQAVYNTTVYSQILAWYNAGNTVQCNYNNRIYELNVVDSQSNIMFFNNLESNNCGTLVIDSTDTWSIRTENLLTTDDTQTLTNKTIAYADNTLTGVQPTITGAASTITSTDLTASKALVSDANGKVDVSLTTSAELAYLSGVTSNVQTQLNSKQGNLTAGYGIDITSGTISADNIFWATYNSTAISTILSEAADNLVLMRYSGKIFAVVKYDSTSALFQCAEDMINYTVLAQIDQGSDVWSPVRSYNLATDTNTLTFTNKTIDKSGNDILDNSLAITANTTLASTDYRKERKFYLNGNGITLTLPNMSDANAVLAQGMVRIVTNNEYENYVVYYKADGTSATDVLGAYEIAAYETRYDSTNGIYWERSLNLFSDLDDLVDEIEALIPNTAISTAIQPSITNVVTQPVFAVDTVTQPTITRTTDTAVVSTATAGDYTISHNVSGTKLVLSGTFTQPTISNSITQPGFTASGGNVTLARTTDVSIVSTNSSETPTITLSRT